MPTSNSNNFNLPGQEILELAFFHIGKYANGKSPDIVDFNIAKKVLNSILKAWAARGLHLWAKEEGLLFLSQYVGEYTLGDTTASAYFTTQSDTTTTKLTASAAAAATTLTLYSTTGIAVGDNVGIVLDNKSLFWTTVATVPSSTSITINSGLTSASTSGNLVYTFTSRAYKPMRVLDCRLLNGVDLGSTTTQTEIYLNPLSYQDYRRQSAVTTNASTPSQYCYNPKINSGTFYLWPRPTDTTYRVQMTYERSIQDIDNLNDDFDFPQEWFLALQWELAKQLANGFGAKDRLVTIMPLAEQAFQDVLDWDNEITSLYLQPDMTGNYY